MCSVFAITRFWVWVVLLGGALALLCLPADSQPRSTDETSLTLESADAEVQRLSPADMIAINGLRFLLRPDKGEDAGHEGMSPLRPFHEPPASYADDLQKLRLLAVVRSGMPVAEETLATHATAFRQSATPDATHGIAPYAIDVLLVLALHPLVGDSARGELLERAERVIAAAEDRRDLTRQRHENALVNIMWRAVMMRAAMKLGLEPPDVASRADLGTLLNLHDRTRAFDRGEPANSAERMTNNLVGLLAAAVYADGEFEFITGMQRRNLHRVVESAPETLKDLHATFNHGMFSDARGALAMTLPPAATPGPEWMREAHLQWASEHVTQRAANDGGIRPTDDIVSKLAVTPHGKRHGHRDVASTALSVIALSGGLLGSRSGDEPLSKFQLPELQRAFKAFAVIQANRGPGAGGPFHQRVNHAIAKGCEFLLRLQNPDGSFRGMMTSFPGNTAIALLALLYGGMDRDHAAIQRGMDWLTNRAGGATAAQGRQGVGTYCASLILLLFQKYYEPEQRRTGVMSPQSPEQYREAKGSMRGTIRTAHRHAIDNLVADLDDAYNEGDGWNYGGAKGDRPDNSNSQYAMLGYKAASLLGCSIPASRFVDEANRLLGRYIEYAGLNRIEVEYTDSMRAGGNTRASRRLRVQPGGWSYHVTVRNLCERSMQMTAAGIGSLAICLDELDVRGELDRDLAEQIVGKMKGAEVYMRSRFPTPDQMQADDYAMFGRGTDGWGIYYNLYAVERACVLAHIHKIGDELDWYRIGAEALLVSQRDNGSWSLPEVPPQVPPDSVPNVVNISKAILFLRRAAPPVITEHRRVQRENDPLDRDIPTGPSDDEGPVTGR